MGQSNLMPTFIVTNMNDEKIETAKHSRRKDEGLANELARKLDRELIELMKVGGIPKAAIARLQEKYAIILNAINDREGLPEYAARVRKAFKDVLAILSSTVDDEEDVGYVIVSTVEDSPEGRIVVTLSSRIRHAPNVVAFWKVQAPRIAAMRIPRGVRGVDEIYAAIRDHVIA